MLQELVTWLATEEVLSKEELARGISCAFDELADILTDYKYAFELVRPGACGWLPAMALTENAIRASVARTPRGLNVLRAMPNTVY